ncbi:MAG: amino acid--tRNA ligase-related protein, partial [Rhodospirillaceae bacterium]
LTCDPSKPAQRLTVQNVFERHAHIDLLSTVDDPRNPAPSPEKLKAAAQSRGLHVGDNDTWEDIFFRVMIERIESKLGVGAPTILCEYPASLAALARRKPDDPRVAERFELYACGVELANAYSELTESAEQRARFEQDRALHEKLYGHALPIDEELLEALSALPQCAGIALGLDRLVMLATGAEDITDVLWAPVR